MGHGHGARDMVVGTWHCHIPTLVFCEFLEQYPDVQTAQARTETQLTQFFRGGARKQFELQVFLEQEDQYLQVHDIQL